MNTVAHDLHKQPLLIAPELISILEKPLIVGASVSANHRGIASPARQLALRVTELENIHTVARDGTPASMILKRISERDLKDRTAVMGVDLLFWDSTRNSAIESINEFRRFTHLVRGLDLPIVLGEIPGLFPPLQPQLKVLNEEIRRFENEYRKCVVLPFDSLYHQILKDGCLEHLGVRYAIHELIPDGLHLSTLAGKIIADILQDTWVKHLNN